MKFLLAFATGVVLGMLIAPDKGSNTRKKLSADLGDVKKSLKTGMSELYEEGINGDKEDAPAM